MTDAPVAIKDVGKDGSWAACAFDQIADLPMRGIVRAGGQDRISAERPAEHGQDVKIAQAGVR